MLGSVKTNIGHTDAAAGVAGLIKTVLALRAPTDPGHPALRARRTRRSTSRRSPFRVSARAQPWRRTGQPRRAGVSSFGIGGTNAHVVLEEAPVPDEAPRPAWDQQILPVSARTPGALAASATGVGDHLDAAPDAQLADVAWTLQTGRHPFAHRAFVVAGDRRDAARALTGRAPGRLVTSPYPAPEEPRETVFLFPGQGGQHVGMAEELYRCHPGFRADIDTCAELAAPRLGLDLRAVLFPGDRDESAARTARERLAAMSVGQPAVFCVEYALARLWQSWGVRPAAVVGHSLGAYAAAAIAGVLPLPEALNLVLERGQLLGNLPAGAMLALPLPAEEIRPRLGPLLSIAAINAPSQCVVAGPAHEVRALRARLAGEGVDGRLLHINAAGHSHVVDPILAAFEKQVAEARPGPPAIPWISDRTGRRVRPDEAMDPAFWAAHLRQTVNFSAALTTVLGSGDAALLEVGPGRSLGSLVRQHPAYGAERVVVASMPHPADESAGSAVLLAAAGRLWQAGVAVDWAAVHAGERRRRVMLPTYPFERRPLRIDEAPARGSGEAEPSGPRPDSTTSAEEWLSESQAAVAAAFRSILGVERVAGHTSFFDLGGDSLLASRVAAILRRELGVQVGVRSVFKAPTVVALAAAVDEQRAAQP